MKKIVVFLISISFIMQASEEDTNINTDIELHDLQQKRKAVPSSSASSTNITTSTPTTSTSTSSNTTKPRDSSQGHGGYDRPQVVTTSHGGKAMPGLVAGGASVGGSANSPGSKASGKNTAPSFDVPSGPTSPANRAIINAQSDTGLAVIVPSLTGATYNFSFFSGTATGGTFSDNNTVLSNTTGIQDLANTAVGTLNYQFGNVSGGSDFVGIELTAGTVIHATLTGTSAGDYFTGTNFTTGTVSDGVFDIVFTKLPSGTVFNIVTGDLGPTGTFTSTDTVYAYFIGNATTGNTSIVNGSLTLIGTVPGTFRYLGTNITGGSLDSITFTGVYATGIASDLNHFSGIGSATGTADGTAITITKNLATNESGTLYIADGTYAGSLFTGLSGLSNPDWTLSQGTFSSVTGLDNATVVNNFDVCIDGIINNGSTGTYHLTGSFSQPIVFTQVTSSGTMQGSTNGLSYSANEIVTGTINPSVDGDFQAGSCP